MSEKIVAQQIGHMINRQKENTRKRDTQSDIFIRTRVQCTMRKVVPFTGSF